MNEESSIEPVAPEPVAPEPVAPEPVAPEPVASEPVAHEPLAPIMLENNADNATLAFFSNPLYLEKINKKKITKTEDYKNHIKFYRKRIISLFKEMIKDEPSTRELKEVHDLFIIKAIHHFQMVDKKDIIQGMHIHGQSEPIQSELEQQQSDLSPEDSLNDDNLTIQEANDKMMKKTINVASLDNYVVINHDASSNEIRFIPMKMEIDLKNPELKNKGVKSKKAKGK
jgi:hypothetical protein